MTSKTPKLVGQMPDGDYGDIRVDVNGRVFIADSDLEKIHGWIKDAERYQVVRMSGWRVGAEVHPNPEAIDAWCDAKIEEARKK